MQEFYEQSRQKQLILRVREVPDIKFEEAEEDCIPCAVSSDEGLFYSISHFLSMYDTRMIVFVGSMSRNLGIALLSNFPKRHFLVISKEQCHMEYKQFTVIKEDPCDELYVSVQHDLAAQNIEYLLIYQNEKKKYHRWEDRRLLMKYYNMQRAAKLLKPRAYMLRSNLSFNCNISETALLDGFDKDIINSYFQKRIFQYSGTHYMQAGISANSIITNFIGDNFEHKEEYDLAEHNKSMKTYNNMRKCCQTQVFCKGTSLDENLIMAYDIIFRVKGYFYHFIDSSCDIINYFLKHRNLLNL